MALLLAAFGLVPMANLLTNGHALPWFGAAAGEWVLYGGVTVLLAAGAAAFAGVAVDRALAAAWRAVMAPRPAWFAWLAAAFTLALSAAIAQYAFAREPHSVDEMVTLWQAKILASGRFALAPHAHREFVSMMNVIDWGRWYAIFPIGGPALFSLGLRAGAAWLVDPVCAAVGVAAAYHFVRRAYDDPTARATAMLLSLSPFFIFMAAGFQSHVPALAALMVALAPLPAWRDAQTPRDAVRASAIVGLALGALVSIRPLDGFLAALVIGAFQISHAVRANGRTRWIAIAAQGAAGAVPVAFMLFANARTTGHPLLLAYNVMWSGVGLGFGASPFGEAHTPVRALVLLSQMLMRMDVYLFEWPLPGILLAVATLFLVRAPVDWDLLAAGLITAFLCGYALYWHDGFWVGPRFIYPTVPLWVLLTVRAPALIAAKWPGAAVRRAAMLLIPFGVIGSLAWPASASGARMRAEQYRASLPQFRTDIGAQARAAHLRNALVFVHEGWGAREMARMWALGVPRRDAEFLYTESDGCALEMALLWEESPPPADSAGRPARLRAATPGYARAGLAPRPDLTGDGTMRFSDQGPWTPQCRSNAVADSAGVSLYPPFLLQNTIDANGALGGDVIYVRDLGAHNAALKTMYGSRTWYRYVPQRAGDDTASVFRAYR